jgi:hypothetical protein
MKLMTAALVSLFAVAAFANEPAKTETKTTTTTAPAAKATAPAATTTTATADMKKSCEGKAGEELKKCEAEMKKTHKK